MEITVNVRLTDKDREIFEALRKTKLLTVNQILRLFFNTQETAYKRMKKLEKAGYVTSRPHVERETGRKIGTCYYLTQQGYEAIGIEHYNPSKLIEPWKHDYRIAVSELYVQLTPRGWRYRDSREVKEIYNLNRNTKVSCSLVRPNPHVNRKEDEILVYVLGSSPAEDTIEKIQAEIARSGGKFDAVMVLHFGTRQNITYKIKTEENTKQEEATWEEPLGIKHLHILKYKRGIDILKQMINPDYILHPPYSEVLKKHGVEYIERHHSDFSEHLVAYKNRTCYLVELITNNLSLIKDLKEYSRESARLRDRFVICLVPAGEEEYWRQVYKKEHYPHIKFLPVRINEPKDLKIQKPTG